MSNDFQIPAKPWSEADVKFLFANAHMLDEATRAELGLTTTEEVVTDQPTPTPETPTTETPTTETPTTETPETTATETTVAVDNNDATVA